MLYELLTTKSPLYEEKQWEELDDLYSGGYEIAEHAHKYLPKIMGETEPRYRERLGCAGYISYLGQIIDYFGAALFSQQITITEAADSSDDSTLGAKADPKFYPFFAKDVDRKGSSFPKLLRSLFGQALLKGRAYVAVDFPEVDRTAIVNRADELALGADRAYANELPIEQVFDFEYDLTGGYSWLLIGRTLCSRESPEQSRKTLQDEFKIWRKDATTGVVTWEKYLTLPYVEGKGPKPTDDIPMVVEPTSTTFKRIPIIELCLPDGLWIGNKIGKLALEHYQRRTALVAAENKSMVALPIVKLGPEVGGPGDPVPSEVTQNPNRAHDPVAIFKGMGFITIGSGDAIEFVEPGGGAYEIVQNQLAELKDEMFRVVYQMAASVDNSSMTMRRSGDSKALDRAVENIVLMSLGSYVRDFARCIYTTISDGRGESIVWTPFGLDKFDIDERTGVLTEALQVDQVSIPSPTFKKAYKTRLALQLVPNVPPTTQDVIRAEIDKGVDAEAAAVAAALAVAAAAGQMAPDKPPPAPAPKVKQKRETGSMPAMPSEQ